MSDRLNWEDIGRELLSHELRHRCGQLNYHANDLSDAISSGEEITDEDLREVEEQAALLFMLLETMDAEPHGFSGNGDALLEALGVDR